MLVVEHEPEVRQKVAEVLHEQGFRVDTALDGRRAIVAIRADPPDLVVLDLDLPVTSGFDVLAWLRQHHDVPVVAVGAGASEADRVLGLELGADDYVAKPVPLRELAARVRAILRRLNSARAPSAMRYGRLVIDAASRRVTLGGREIDLRPREFDLLLFLASSPGQAFTRGQILEHVWESSAGWQDPDTVTEHVRRLRRKIERDASRPEWLVTIRGVGYRFEA